jgi:hypothetical protein
MLEGDAALARNYKWLGVRLKPRFRQPHKFLPDRCHRAAVPSRGAEPAPPLTSRVN